MCESWLARPGMWYSSSSEGLSSNEEAKKVVYCQLICSDALGLFRPLLKRRCPKAKVPNIKFHHSNRPRMSTAVTAPATHVYIMHHCLDNSIRKASCLHWTHVKEHCTHLIAGGRTQHGTVRP